MVPISLLVSLEMVHVAQGYFMKNDFHMYDEQQNFRMDPRTTNINEELGQVEYVFSDKTGTLTRNVMEFKKFSTATTIYSVDKPSNKKNLVHAKQQKELQNLTKSNIQASKRYVYIVYSGFLF